MSLAAAAAIPLTVTPPAWPLLYGWEQSDVSIPAAAAAVTYRQGKCRAVSAARSQTVASPSEQRRGGGGGGGGGSGDAAQGRGGSAYRWSRASRAGSPSGWVGRRGCGGLPECCSPALAAAGLRSARLEDAALTKQCKELSSAARTAAWVQHPPPAAQGGGFDGGPMSVAILEAGQGHWIRSAC